MVEEITIIVKKNISKFLEKFENNIESIFLIGSMCEEDYNETLHNDYDIRFILKTINKESYEGTIDIITNIMTELESINYDVSYSDIVGPIKRTSSTTRNVLLHSIILTKAELDDLPTTHKLSYSQKYKILYGDDVLNQYRSICLTKEDILNDVEGINYCINMLQNKKNICCIRNSDYKLVTVVKEASIDDLKELVAYSIKKTLNNVENFLISDNYCYKITDLYKNFSEEEKALINSLEIHDEIDIFIEISISILNKAKDFVLMNNKVRFYNSIKWGIQETDIGNIRNNGMQHLKELKFATTDYKSLSYKNFCLNFNSLLDAMKGSEYIIIFEPPNENFQRYGIDYTDNQSEVRDFISSKGNFLDEYNVSLIEKINEIDSSFCGTVISNERGNVVIETLKGSVDSRFLTSTGADYENIECYEFNGYELNSRVPSIILKIKKDCEFISGYYEFAYGEVKGKKGVFYTFYSDNEKYRNIFKGRKFVR